MLISGAHLRSSLSCVGTRSRKPLSSCTPREWSLASLEGPEFFPYSLPASCAAPAPFKLSSHSQPQSSPWGLTSKAWASAPSTHPPRQESRQLSQVGECWSAPILLCRNLSTLLSAPLLLRSPLWHLKFSPLYPPVRGLPSVWKLFLLHSSLSEAQVPFLFFFFFTFLLEYNCFKMVC